MWILYKFWSLFNFPKLLSEFPSSIIPYRLCTYNKYKYSIYLSSINILYLNIYRPKLKIIHYFDQIIYTIYKPIFLTHGSNWHLISFIPLRHLCILPHLMIFHPIHSYISDSLRTYSTTWILAIYNFQIRCKNSQSQL